MSSTKEFTIDHNKSPRTVMDWLRNERYTSHPYVILHGCNLSLTVILRILRSLCVEKGNVKTIEIPGLYAGLSNKELSQVVHKVSRKSMQRKSI